MRFSAGTNIGGGTFWGLCKLLTGMDNFDDILSLSSQGDNSNVRTEGSDSARPQKEQLHLWLNSNLLQLS